MKRRFDKPIMIYLNEVQADMLSALIGKFSNDVSKANISTVMRLALENLYSQVISQKKEG